MPATSAGSTFPAIAALAAASAAAWCGWPPGTSLTAMFVVMSHSCAEVLRHVLQVISAVRGEKAARHLEHVLLGHEPLVRGERRMDAEHRREPRVILARHAGVGGDHQAADRGRGERDRLRHLCLRQLEERPGRDRAAEDRGDRAVEAALAAPRGQRLVDAPRDLVAEHHRREHVAAARAGPLRHRDRGRRDDRADVRDAAQVAVVRGRGVAHHRVHPRRVRDGQPAPAVEPEGRLLRASRAPLASSRMIREDTMSAPIAALAIVLAITIRARSSASGGRSPTLVPARNRASSPAMLILRPRRSRSS